MSRCEDARQASSRLGSIGFGTDLDEDAGPGDEVGVGPRRERFEGGRETDLPRKSRFGGGEAEGVINAYLGMGSMRLEELEVSSMSLWK